MDPRTREALQQHYDRIRPQLKQEFEGLSDSDLEASGSDPRRLVSIIQRQTNEPTEQIERKVEQLVSRVAGYVVEPDAAP